MSKSCSGPGFLFIAQGSPNIGGGHINRCSALADGLSSLGASVQWLVNSGVEPMLLKKGFSEDAITSVEDLFRVAPEATALIVKGLKPGLCVIDSYDATPPLIKKLREICPVMLIDDCRPRPLEEECDMLLNYNLGADSLGYSPMRAGLLLGPRYALLRKEFRGLISEEGDTILIIPGASDMHNVAEYFVNWWQSDWPNVELVLGSLVDEEKFLRLSSMVSMSRNLSVLHDPPDLPERMAKARAVICTSSVTSYETLALRKRLAVFQVAENQVRVGKEIAKRDLGINLGMWSSFGPMELQVFVSEPPPQPHAIVNLFGANAAARAIIKLLKRDFCIAVC